MDLVNVIVRKSTFDATIQGLLDEPVLSLDTETTGLRPYHGHMLFSVIIGSLRGSYYFNFNEYPALDPDYLIPDDYLEKFHSLFQASDSRLWFLHNAKFDMAMLARHDLTLRGFIHDTMAVARIINPGLLPRDFSLDAQCKLIGLSKDNTVAEYVRNNKLTRKVKVAGKLQEVSEAFYQLVPFEIMAPYGLKDADITLKLGQAQLVTLDKLDMLGKTSFPELPSIHQVLTNEYRLTRTVFEMEDLGVKVDADFCRRALSNIDLQEKILFADFINVTGKPFSPSPLLFKEIFKDEQWVYGPKTATGQVNPSFDSEVLVTFKHPAASIILKMRTLKNERDFYQGFLYHVDSESIIHTSLNQHGTVTGRFSSSNPNLQNLKKDEEDDLEQAFVVRRAIVPREGMVFHMLDFQAMEYRLMLEYAAKFAKDFKGVMTLIEMVRGGLDVHQATANVAGTSRPAAKTVNFAILYGSGDKLIAEKLKISVQEAREIRASIFNAAPEIKIFIDAAMKTAQKRGSVTNWFGRRYNDFPTKIIDGRLMDFSYRAPNYLIQGGCADVVKLAMNKVRDYLLPYETRLVLSVHDELVLEGPPDESSIIHEIKDIMESAYPAKYLKLTCSVDHSFKSLADKVKGIAPETRNQISKQVQATLGGSAKELLDTGAATIP